MANATDIRSWATRTEAQIRKGAGPSGEGSRGGHILGHTKSGQPIYQSAGYTNAKQLVHHVEQAHGQMGPDDHAEAAGAHRAAAKEAGKGSPAAAVHEAHARAHELVGANKGLAQHFGGQAAPGLAHGMDHSAAAPSVGAAPASGVEARHHGIKSGDAANAATKAVADKGGAATPADHATAAKAHQQASEANGAIGATGAANHHAEMAKAHQAAATGQHAEAAKAFAGLAHNSDHAAARSAIAKQESAKATSPAPTATGHTPPEQAPMSKVREKLEKAKGAPPALDFAGHRSAGQEHNASLAAEKAGKPKSAARHASAAADMVTKGLAVGDVSKAGHDTAAALHQRAAGLAEKAGKKDDAAYHKTFAAAHALGSKAEASGAKADHAAAGKAFRKAENPRIAAHHEEKAAGA